MATNRAAVFLDAGYLENVLRKDFPGIKINFGKLAVELCQGHDLLRTYYYNCPPFQSNPPTPEENERKRKADQFYFALGRLPRFEVRLGRLAMRSCKKCGESSHQQKRADLMLGVDLVNLSARNQIATAIIVAGDSDFLPAVAVAKECGVLIHLFHGGPSNRPHNELYSACDERTEISKELIDRVKHDSK